MMSMPSGTRRISWPLDYSPERLPVRQSTTPRDLRREMSPAYLVATVTYPRAYSYNGFLPFR